MTQLPRILAVGEEPPPLAPSPSGGRGRAKEKRRAGARFQSINAFLDVTMAGLERAGLAVWLLLWRDTKPDGLVRTSQADLARRAGCNPRTVRRALVGLLQAGLVEVVSPGGLRRGLSVYRVHPLRQDTS
jgi:hypothetical protein